MKLLVARLWLMAWPTLVVAQDRPTIVSPEVRKDRSVVFRLWAPKASEVQLTGSWMGPTPPLSLTKGTDGVWTATAGPLEPNVYSYAFLVDGVRANDPSCRCAFTWAGRAAETRLLIPGDTARPWEPRDRPAGTLHHERFFSARLQRMRRFVVYTPPGYHSSGTRQYPALVLLPGTPGDEDDWTSGGGCAEVMFDNLIADGRMTPMVVVMHASDVLDTPGKRRADENLGAFETVLVDELLPLVKERYRVSRDPSAWGIAGLSLGGEFGLYLGLKHPELFRTVASLSGSLVPASFDQRFGALLADPKAGRDYRLIWVACGSEDIFFGGAKEFAQRLLAANIPHAFRSFPGHHSLPVARQELAELLPLLFKP